MCLRTSYFCILFADHLLPIFLFDSSISPTLPHFLNYSLNYYYISSLICAIYMLMAMRSYTGESLPAMSHTLRENWLFLLWQSSARRAPTLSLQLKLGACKVLLSPCWLASSCEEVLQASRDAVILGTQIFCHIRKTLFPPDLPQFLVLRVFQSLWWPLSLEKRVC